MTDTIAEQTKKVLDRLTIQDVKTLFSLSDKSEFDNYVLSRIGKDILNIEHILSVLYPNGVDMIDINNLRNEIEDGYYDYALFYHLEERISESIDVLLSMGNCCILNIKVITDVFDELKGVYQSHTSEYSRKFICPCRKAFNDMSRENKDIRLKIRCCPYCGRSSKEWKLVSARMLSLCKTIKSKKWYIKDKIIKNDFGIEISPHPQEQYCDLYSRLISNEELEQYRLNK